MVLQVFVQYTRYVSVLKWLTFSLLAYFGTVMVVDIPWGEMARGIFLPTVSRSTTFWTSAVAILGTTISPYLFFWQASQEAEDVEASPERDPLKYPPHQAESALERIRLDTYIGYGMIRRGPQAQCAKIEPGQTYLWLWAARREGRRACGVPSQKSRVLAYLLFNGQESNRPRGQGRANRLTRGPITAKSALWRWD